MYKVEIRIRHCCCCSLAVAAILIAIYTIIVYGVLLGLASWGLSKTISGNTNDAEQCLPGYTFQSGNTRVTIDPYFCTMGWYTEELKFTGVREPVLVIDIILYILVIISAALIFVGLCVDFCYLLLPWIGFMCLDIIRGIISCILIFVYAHNAQEPIKPIATGIFFLGLQFFHLSLVLIMVAKFQKMLNIRRGLPPFENDPIKSDKSILVESSSVYPPPGGVIVGQQNYGTSPRFATRDPYNAYGTYQAGAPDPRIHQRAPSDLSPMRRDEYPGSTLRPGQGTPYGGPTGYQYGSYHHRQASNFGKTM